MLDDEPGFDDAQALIQLANDGDVVLRAPDHATLEMAAAVTKAFRRQRVNRVGAADLLALIPAFPVNLHQSQPLILPAAEISPATSLGFYDCLFVALAEPLGLPLVTSDDRQAGRANEFARAVGLLDALESLERDA